MLKLGYLNLFNFLVQLKSSGSYSMCICEFLSVYLLVTANCWYSGWTSSDSQLSDENRLHATVPAAGWATQKAEFIRGGGSAGESFMYNSEVCSVSQGTEEKSGLCSRSCRETGFTRGDIAPLAHPVSADFFTVFLWCKSATLMLFVFI